MDARFAGGDTSLALESEMLSGHLEGRFLNVLVHAMKATRILEIGLFTGYSALAMAEALPEHGTLLACELDPYAAAIARRAFDASPHGNKIRIEIGHAEASLKALVRRERYVRSRVHRCRQSEVSRLFRSRSRWCVAGARRADLRR